MLWFRNRQSDVVPAHTIQRSARAKHVRLKVMVQDGLCVIVPRHFDVAKVPAILKRQARWIARALARVEQLRHHLVQQPLPFLPERLELLALGEVWSVHYRESSRARLVLHEGARELVFSGKTFPRAAVITMLKGWLRGRVASGLAPLVFELARQKGLTIKKVLPRSQRTRWASCSAKGTLSLNTKLLFLAPELMRYVLIHELCHITHMNHLGTFWRLVETHEPHFRLLKRQLRDAWKKLPPWLTAP